MVFLGCCIFFTRHRVQVLEKRNQKDFLGILLLCVFVVYYAQVLEKRNHKIFWDVVFMCFLKDTLLKYRKNELKRFLGMLFIHVCCVLQANVLEVENEIKTFSYDVVFVSFFAGYYAQEVEKQNQKIQHRAQHILSERLQSSATPFSLHRRRQWTSIMLAEVSLNEVLLVNKLVPSCRLDLISCMKSFDESFFTCSVHKPLLTVPLSQV